MKRLEVRGAVRPLKWSLSFKGLIRDQQDTTDSCVSYGRYSHLSYDTQESVPTQQRERMVVDPVNQYQKL